MIRVNENAANYLMMMMMMRRRRLKEVWRKVSNPAQTESAARNWKKVAKKLEN